MEKKQKSKPINTDFNFKKLASDILAKREKEDLNFRQVAKLLKVAPSTVYNLEAGGKFGMKVKDLTNVCNWLNVPVQTYFTK